MTAEALSPTPEQLRKFSYDAPQRDQNVNREAFTRRSPLQRLFDRGELSYPMHRAAEKLYVHHRGAMGVRVQYGEDTALNTDTEFPRTYHAQKLAEAEKHVLAWEWFALTQMIDETRTPEEIGRIVLNVSKREICRQRGVSLVSTGLTRLAELWGLQQRQRIPIR